MGLKDSEVTEGSVNEPSGSAGPCIDGVLMWNTDGVGDTVPMEHTFKFRGKQFQNPMPCRHSKSSPVWGCLFEDSNSSL